MKKITPSNAIYALGSTLSEYDRDITKRIFGGRFTGDWTPQWASQKMLDGASWPLQFASDYDWMLTTEFAVTPKGSLDLRYRRCFESPTWPDREDLRSQPRCVWAFYGPNLRYPGWNIEYAAWRREKGEMDRLAARLAQPKAGFDNKAYLEELARIDKRDGIT